MAELLVKKLTAEDFNSERYVQELSQSSVGGLELQQQRHKIQLLAEDTNAQLKKNVYMNYMQFIETAKEISYLESEMYQLSHLITEQKSLLSSLLDMSISGERCVGNTAQELMDINPQEIRQIKEKENRKKLTVLLEKIEGCLHVMEVEDRYLVFDGDLVELNQDDYSALQRVHAYLLNDSLMIATWLSDRRGPVRYAFESLYPLDQVLMVNIKDRGTTKNAFKVLIFPETRVFTASNPKIKQDWLDEIEGTKQNKMAYDKQKAGLAHQQQKERHLSLSKDESLDKHKSPNCGEEDDGFLNPFQEVPDVYVGPPEWVQELPEDLDQATAQRNFEDAVTLIDRGREYFNSAPKTAIYNEMRRSLEGRVCALVEVLQGELRVTAEKSLQGGPRSVRRATTLLVHLNKSIQACELFLDHRGAILKAGLKRLRLEGNTVVYVRQLCSIFFRNLLETGKEFSRALPCNRSCTSALVVWCHSELNNFAVMFQRHVFTTQSSFTTVAECVSRADHHCQQLTDLGLDLTFALHTLLLRDVEKSIKEGRDKMIEAVKLRSQEDTWKSLKYDRKEQLDKFIEDMNDIGISNLESYVGDDYCLSLTNNSVQFSRAYLGYLEDVLRLWWPETEVIINNSLVEIFSAQIKHCKQSSLEPQLKAEVPIVRRNTTFLLDVLLSLSEYRYAEATGQTHPNFPGLHANWINQNRDIGNNAATISKYESNYI